MTELWHAWVPLTLAEQVVRQHKSILNEGKSSNPPVVSTHDGTDTRSDGLGKAPHVDFVSGPVVNVGRDGQLVRLRTRTGRVGDQVDVSRRLLFVTEEVPGLRRQRSKSMKPQDNDSVTTNNATRFLCLLGGSDYPCVLNTLDAEVTGDTRPVRIGPPSFKVSAHHGVGTDRSTSNRSKSDIDT